MAELKIGNEHKSNFLDRMIFRVGSAIAARIDEVGPSVNTDVASSYKLLDRIGDRDTDTTERDNRNRFTKLSAIRKCYKGEAKRGNLVLGSITDFHAALQMGQGLRSKDQGDGASADNPSPEMEAWKIFLDLNDLDQEGLIDLAVAGELDGQVLMRFAPDTVGDEPTVRAWIVPLTTTQYRVEFQNPWETSRAVLYPDDVDGKREVLEPHEFAFVRFRGVKDGTYGIPRGLRVLEEMENLHDAVRDWRKVNRIHSSPTPIFKAKDVEGLKRIKAAINGMNWKIGMAFVMLAEDSYELVGLSGGELESLKEEIVKLAQFVSGATNTPVNFMGFPDLMSNRSVADSEMEPAIASTGKTQKQWIGFFEEVKSKIFAMLNVEHGREVETFYDPANVDVKFPAVSQGSEGETITAWLPAVLSNKVSLSTFHTKVGLDPDDELKAIEQEGEDGQDEQDDTDERVNQIVLDARRQAEGGEG
jgi:hypothetical protein